MIQDDEDEATLEEGDAPEGDADEGPESGQDAPDSPRNTAPGAAPSARGPAEKAAAPAHRVGNGVVSKRTSPAHLIDRRGKRRALYSRPLYDELVAAFRETPGRYAAVARACNVSAKLARHAWLKGWLDSGVPWAIPVKDVVGDEATRARVRAAELAQAERARQDEERRKAAQESVEALAEERRLVRTARADVLGALVVGAELLSAMRFLAQEVSRAIMAGELKGNPKLALSLMKQHSEMIAKAVAAADTVVALSRLDRGASTANVAIAVSGVPEREMTWQEAVEELEDGEELLEAVRRRAGSPLGALPPAAE